MVRRWHTASRLLVKQRTQLIIMMCAVLAEFGVAMPRGLHHALALARRLTDGHAAEVPTLAEHVVASLVQQIGAVQEQLATPEKELSTWHRSSELSQRLATIPGAGVITATALDESVTEPERFRSGRHFAASLPPPPLQKSSGGKEKLAREELLRGCTMRLSGRMAGSGRHPRRRQYVPKWDTASGYFLVTIVS